MSDPAPGSSTPFFRAPCPSCGAPVELRSATSAFAVCGYCRSSLVPRNGALERIGQVAAVFEDYSRLRLGAAGRFGERGFSVIGRLQMQYAGGGWNEWHLLLDDGSTGWLSDASGQYALLQPRAWPPQAPGYDELGPGRSFLADDARYTVSDRREASCRGAEGELPFPVHERWTGRLVDARSGDRFITLDWSDTPPAAYSGRAVRLSELSMQFLRSGDEIAETAGRLRGALASLSCPSCGASLPVAVGLTLSARCPSCGSELDTAGSAATLRVQGRAAEARTAGTSLQVGDAGVLRGQRWMVLGVARQRSRADGQNFDWTEYLLYHAGQGFRWLSEADGKWLWAEAADTWPMRMTGDRVRLGDTLFKRDDQYDAAVQGTWGSFPWELKQGDRAACEEFVPAGKSSHPAGTRLVVETSADEQVWSVCTPIEASQVLAAFGRSGARLAAGKASAAATTPAQADGPGAAVRQWAGYAMIGHIMLWFTDPTGLGFAIGVMTMIGMGIWGWMIEGDT